MEVEIQRKLVDLPKRVTGSHTSKFKTVNIITNHYMVELKPFEKIFIFRVKITPMIAADNKALRTKLMQKALPEIKSFISNSFLTQTIPSSVA